MASIETGKKRILVALPGGGFFWETVALLSRFDDRFCYHYLVTRALPQSFEEMGIPQGTAHRVQSLTVLGRPRKRHTAAALVRSLWEVGAVVRRVDPDVVLSVGTSLAIPLCFWARLLGIRAFFVESITRVTAPSLTGRVLDALGLCDRLYVQWPEGASLYKKAQFVGNVL